MLKLHFVQYLGIYACIFTKLWVIIYTYIISRFEQLHCIFYLAIIPSTRLSATVFNRFSNFAEKFTQEEEVWDCRQVNFVKQQVLMPYIDVKIAFCSS